MKVYDSQVFIDKDTLLKNKNLCFEFIFPAKLESLISGVILSPDKVPIPNACIEVFSQNSKLEETYLGRAFSNDYGEYGFTLKVNPCLTYIFYVFAPL